MRSYQAFIFSLGAALPLLLGAAGEASAAGVVAGGSSLFSVPDYTDTFTGTDDGGLPGRPYVAAGLPTYPIESTYGNPITHYLQQPGSAYSIASDLGPGFVQGTGPLYPTDLGGNASGAGSDTGFTQTGGNGLGYGIEYWLRDDYVVQIDAVQTTDRVDITSGDVPTGTAISAANSISVFFRGDGSGNASIYNGSVDTPIAGQPGYESFNTGIAAWNDAGNGGQSRWYNYAVRFNQPANEIELYVNENSVGVIDLNTFAGGTYSAGFSNQFVSVSTGTVDRTWTDNFQVGGNGAPTLPTVINSFNDDFGRPDGPATGYKTYRGNWGVQGERLVATTTTEETLAFVGSPPEALPTDFEFSFDWEFLAPGSNGTVGKHAGAVFNWDATADRFNDASHGYNLFWIDRAEDHGLSLVRFDGASLVSLHSGTFDLLPEPPENVRVQVVGDNIRVYADDQLVIDVVDNTYRGGRAGLWSWAGDQTVAFDNIHVAVPEPGTMALAALGALGLCALRRRRRKG